MQASKFVEIVDMDGSQRVTSSSVIVTRGYSCTTLVLLIGGGTATAMYAGSTHSTDNICAHDKTATKKLELLGHTLSPMG